LAAYLFAFGIATAGGNNACRVALRVVSAERVKGDDKTVAPTCPVGTVKNENCRLQRRRQFNMVTRAKLRVGYEIVAIQNLFIFIIWMH
jgi:hypothetical protein